MNLYETGPLRLRARLHGNRIDEEKHWSIISLPEFSILDAVKEIK